MGSPNSEHSNRPLRLVTGAGAGSLAPGTELGPYVVAELLGMGGMGEVYRAFDPRLGRHVAIKMLRDDLAHDVELRVRFERETRILSTLAHKNICTVFDTGTHAGHSFIVMELLEGRTLEEELRLGPMPLTPLLDVAVQVMDALRTAHERGLVHRDIKSANIFLTGRDDAKVLDFGIAKSQTDAAPKSASEGATREGIVLGTVAFMSPEQARGEPLDARSDLFSFGIVLYHMATGSVPYMGGAISVLARIATPVPAPRLRDQNPTLPDELDAIVARALKKDRNDRYASSAEMLMDLRRLRSDVASGRIAAVAPITPVAKARRWMHRHRLPIGAALVALVALAGATSWGLLTGVGSSGPIRSLLVQDCHAVSASPSISYQCRVIASNITAALDSLPGLTLRFREAADAEEGTNPALAGRRARTDAVLTTQLDSSVNGWHARVLVTATRSSDVLWSGSYPVAADEVASLPGRIAFDATAAILANRETDSENRTRPMFALRQAEYQSGLRTAESLARAVTMYRELLSRDSTVARAWAGLAMARLLQTYYSSVDPAPAYEDAINAARRALALDDGVAEAHAALGLALRDARWDWSQAEMELRTAVAIDSSSASALQWYAELLHMTGRSRLAEPLVRAAVRERPLELTPRAVHGWILISTGRERDAITLLRSTLEMNPDHHLSRFFLGAALLQAGAIDGAVAEMRRAVAIAPEARFYRAGLGHVLARAGQREEAQGILNELRADSGPSAASPYDIAILLTGLGDHEGALRELERAVQQRRRDAVGIKVDPLLAPLRADPRFGSLVRRAGLPADL